MLHVEVHNNTVRERLNKYGFFGTVEWENLGCKVASEQIARALEECPLDRQDQIGDVRS